MDNDVSNTHTELKHQLLNKMDRVLPHLLPRGKIINAKWQAKHTQNGEELQFGVECTGQNKGHWVEETNKKTGDILTLWATLHEFDPRFELAAIFHSINNWLKENVSADTLTNLPEKEIELMGKPSNEWHYLDVNGEPQACVFEFETNQGRRLRPWDITSQTFRLPYPRPLYNLPRIKSAQHVVIVDDESSADVLVNEGIVGTTSMLLTADSADKVDWQPLAAKHIIIWPINDKRGLSMADKVGQAVVAAGAQSVQIVSVVNKPQRWGVLDAVADGLNLINFLNQSPKQQVTERKTIKTYSLDQLLDDRSPIPDDLIAPRLLTPQGLLVIGGAPKVGKSDFMLSLITHMAAGETFLIFKPPRPLRIFYFQAEIHYHYLRERIKMMRLSEMLVWKASENLVITPHTHLTLNEEGLNTLEKAILKESQNNLFDIIVIDPLRNVFDGGSETATENDNSGMLFFLRHRLDVLRQRVNPDAGIILVHHTKKLSKKQLIEEPFDSFAGASSLRSYYTSGAIFYRPEADQSTRAMVFELRNGPSLPLLHLDKEEGHWVEVDMESQRLINPDYGQKLDAERRRKHDIILQIIFDEANKGRAYTINQFAERLEGKAGLGGERSIRERLGVLATQGYIKFFQDYERYGLQALSRVKFGYLCVEDMQLRLYLDGATESLACRTEKAVSKLIPVIPTHYKCPNSGAALPVENPNIWNYTEDSHHGNQAH